MTNPFIRSRDQYAGAFVRNPKADVPKAVAYGQIASQLEDLHVPTTVPAVPSIGNAVLRSRTENGMAFLSFSDSRKDWNDREINSPPEEYLARKDLQRQEAERKKMMDNLTDEQRKLLAMVDAGLLNSPSSLKEEK